MSKRLRIPFVIIFLIILFTAQAVASVADWKDVIVVDDGIASGYRTIASNVDQLFKQQGIQISDMDMVSWDLKNPIEHGMKIEIGRPFDVKLSIGFNEEKITVKTGDTVKSIIDDLRLTRGVAYHYDGDLDTVLTPGDTLDLYTYKREVFEINDVIPFGTRTEHNPELFVGTEKVAYPGAEGIKSTLVKVDYTNEFEQSRMILAEEVISAPQDRVIHIGTKPLPKYVPGLKDLVYSQQFVMSATAYTAGPESTGKNPGDPGYGITATGKQVSHGIVAVDPRVIPLGTRLYVEGYGVALAADTGGSIKGMKIDLFYENLNDALRFGRRNLKVYVLE